MTKNTAGTTKRSHQSASARSMAIIVVISRFRLFRQLVDHLDDGVPAIDVRMSVSACTLRSL